MCIRDSNMTLGRYYGGHQETNNMAFEEVKIEETELPEDLQAVAAKALGWDSVQNEDDSSILAS